MTRLVFLIPVMLACAAAPVAGRAGSLAVLHDFLGARTGAAPLGGSDASLVADAAGNLYGTTLGGDVTTDAGTVFRLSPPAAGAHAWTQTVLLRFTGGADGASPAASLLTDGQGGFFGTTFGGGTGSCAPYGPVAACGTVFRLLPPADGRMRWTEHVLYRFTGGADGGSPLATLIQDSNGALYGTTLAGGGTNCRTYGTGCGVIFRLDPPAGHGAGWTATTLYAFQGGPDGANPQSGLIADSAGALYGTAYYGGDSGCGCGVVFRLSPPAQGGAAWTQAVLHSFKGGRDGSYPSGQPVFDTSGALLGTASGGGGSQACSSGCGVAFQLVPPQGHHATHTPWTETVLHRFHGPDGAYPNAALTPDGSGDFVTTTYYGGRGKCALPEASGCGAVIKLTPPEEGSTDWSETVLHSLDGGRQGAILAGGLLAGSDGTLYGAAIQGGRANTCPDNAVHGCGTVFSLAP